MKLAFSPQACLSQDGRTIVGVGWSSEPDEDEKRDEYKSVVWAIDVASGRATLIDKGSGPDGYFERPTISPDGSRVLYMRGLGFELVVARSARPGGSHAEVPVSRAGHFLGGARPVLPLGASSFAYVLLGKAGVKDPNLAMFGDVWVGDFERTDARPLTEFGDVDEWLLTGSASAEFLVAGRCPDVWAGAYEVWKVPLSGGGGPTCLFSSTFDLLHGSGSSFVLSPDAHRLLLGWTREDTQGKTTGQRAVVRLWDLIERAHVSIDLQHEHVGDLVWSPQSSALAYDAAEAGATTRSLWSVSIPQGKARRVCGGIANYWKTVGWSAGTDELLFVADGRLEAVSVPTGARRLVFDPEKAWPW